MLKFKDEILNYVYILLGSLIMAFGVVSFLSPNHITTGGKAGLAIVLHSVVNLSIGVLIALVNIPLIIIGWKYLGQKFALKTVICILLIVVFVDLFAQVLKIPNLSTNLILSNFSPF